MPKEHVRSMVMSAVFAALIFLGTFIIRIQVANGYVHFGDGLIYAGAALLGAPWAAAAAALGGFLSDAAAGYMPYAPWTALIKALMAIAAALILRRGTRENADLLRALWAAVAAGVINVGGYFLTDLFMFGTGAAIVGLWGNALQSAFGVVLFMVLRPMLGRIRRYL